jgi:glycosyltransferase involved in cell wall biosynthesis
LSHQIWSKKLIAYKDLDLHIVTPSRWLGDCAKKSSLLGRFPVTVIPNSLDTDIFRPMGEEEQSSEWTDLRESTAGKKVVLYGAVGATTDIRKGYDKLLGALQYMEKNGMADDLQLVVFGASSSDLNIDVNIPIHYVGYVSETEELVSLYNMADVMVVPSLSENLSCAIMESLSCQTPVVAFNIGGNSDMIDHQINGYLAKEKDNVDLARGILWCLDNNEGNHLGIDGRKKVIERFAPEVVGKQYLDLYISAYENALHKRKS